MVRKSSNRKSNKRGQLLLATAAAGVGILGLFQSVQAASSTYTWSNSGTGTWDTTATNWPGGTNPWTSANGSSSIADFNTASATATVSANVYTNGIILDNTATISGGTINFVGSAATIDVKNAASGSTISSDITNSLVNLKITNSSSTPNSTINMGNFVNPTTAGVTTTIDSGVTVKMVSGKTFSNARGGLVLNGTLNLNSSAANSIVFNSGILAGGTGSIINSGTAPSNGAYNVKLGGSSTFGGTIGENVTLNLNSCYFDFSGDNQSTKMWQLLGTFRISNANAWKTTSKGTFRGAGGTLELASADLRINSTNFALSDGGTSVTSVGFAALNGDRTVTWTGTSTASDAPAATFTWGNGISVTLFDKLVLGNANATNKIIWASPIDLGGTTNTTRQISVVDNANGAGGEISGAISDSNATKRTLEKVGTGTLILSGNNTYQGPTKITTGTLVADHANALGNGGTITFSGGTLQYTANSAGQDWASRIKNSGSAIVLDTQANAVTLGALDSTNTAGLTKLGTGRLNLTGTNGYTGTTTVSAGTLSVNGSLASANVYVNNSGTLGGTGTLSGAVSVASGGHLAPGNSIGTQTQASLTLASGSILDFQFGTAGTLASPGNSDRIAVTGALTLPTNASGITLNVIDNLNDAGKGNIDKGVYSLFTYGSLVGGNSDFNKTFAIGTTPTNFGTTAETGNKKYVFTNTGLNGGTIFLTISDNSSLAATTYTLAASADKSRILTGQTATVTAAINNTGTLGTNDALNYSGLNLSGGGGSFSGAGLPKSNGSLGGGSNDSGSLTFTGGSIGLQTINATVASATNATLGGNATKTGDTAVQIAVLDKRQISAQDVVLGRVMAGRNLNTLAAQSVTLNSQAGDHNSLTDVQVNNGHGGSVTFTDATASKSLSGVTGQNATVATSGTFASLNVNTLESGLGDTYNNVAVGYTASVFNPIEMIANNSTGGYNAFNSGSNTVQVSGSNGNYVFATATHTGGTNQAYVNVQTPSDFTAPEYVLLALNGVSGLSQTLAVDVANAINAAGLSGVHATYNGEDLATNKMLADWSGYSAYKGTDIGDFDVLVKFDSYSAANGVLAFDFSQIDGGAASVSAIGVVPEPTSLGLMALPALGLLARRRRAMKKA